MEGLISRRFKLIYSATSRRQIKSLHPDLRPTIKSKIEHISDNPFSGKYLERELSGYLSLRVKRYRIIYRVKTDEKVIEVHYVGHRKDIYERFSEQIKSDK